jgi:hypothetical protein
MWQRDAVEGRRYIQRYLQLAGTLYPPSDMSSFMMHILR